MKKKIKNSVARRFEITKTGKVLFTHQYKAHLQIRKSRSRHRRQKEPAVLHGKFARKIKQMMGAA